MEENVLHNWEFILNSYEVFIIIIVIGEKG